LGTAVEWQTRPRRAIKSSNAVRGNDPLPLKWGWAEQMSLRAAQRRPKPAFRAMLGCFAARA